MQTKEIFYSKEGILEREFRLKTLRNCGIYIIQNKINNHCYIGSSKNIQQRFYRHKYDLNKNIHSNQYLQNAWNKYGEENFEFITLEYHAYIEKIIGRENRYIKLYKPEYNIIQVNTENNFFHSEETKKKISLKSKQKFIDNPKLKEDFIKRLTSKPPWNKGHVNKMSLSQRNKISEAMKKRKPIFHSKEIIDKIASKNKIPIYQYDLEDNFIKKWDSATDAARSFGVKSSGNFYTAKTKGIKLYNSYWKSYGSE